MDEAAYNYAITANVNDSASCLYNANCITGPGNPYWLNDPCYAWVISVDNYCCENEWDTICQATYSYCEGTWEGPLPPARIESEEIHVYPNPTSGLLNISKEVDVEVYNILGEMLINKDNITILDIRGLNPGMYTIRINNLITKQIIKN